MLGFGAIGQFAIGQGPTGLAAETILVTKWYNWLSEPVRYKIWIRAGLRPYFVSFLPSTINVQLVGIETNDVSAIYVGSGGSVRKRATVAIVEIPSYPIANVVIKEIKYSRGYS